MKQPLFRKDHSVHPFGNYRLTVTAPSLRSSLLLGLSLSLNLLFIACPDNYPPPVADCDPGWHPCETDSTECCLDTTSHNFVWEIDTLGDYGSYLNDVAIIDENDVWVVGYIKVGDSTYNAAQWDGSEWELMVIKVAPYFAFAQITSINAFLENDIWVGTNVPYYWNGTSWKGYFPEDGWENGWNFDGYIQGIWGTSSSDIYFVGGNGSIVHYDGSGFEKMESRTEAPIINIWGLDKEHVWAVAYTNSPTIKNKVLFYDGDMWSFIYEDRVTDNWPPEDYTRPSGSFLSTWAYGDTFYLGCASVWKQSINEESGILIPLEDISWQLGWGIAHIRGNNSNDIFVTTYFGSEVSHFNGAGWKFFDNLKSLDPDGINTTASIGVKGDIVVLVGENLSTGRAIVYRGYR